MKRGQEDTPHYKYQGKTKKCMNAHTDLKVGQSPSCDSQNKVSDG